MKEVIPKYNGRVLSEELIKNITLSELQDRIDFLTSQLALRTETARRLREKNAELTAQLKSTMASIGYRAPTSTKNLEAIQKLEDLLTETEMSDKEFRDKIREMHNLTKDYLNP